MRKSVRVFVLALLLSALSAPVYGWNKHGHMIVAALAFRELKAKNPARAAELVELLKNHEHFDDFWAPVLELVPASGRDEALFMLAARWPDDMRANKFKLKVDNDNKSLFHRRVWHFADKPIKFAGAPAGIGDDIVLSPAEPLDQDEGFPHLLKALPQNLSVLNGGDTKPKRGAGTLLGASLIGDIHQPLHAASRFSTDFQNGDKGGNDTGIILPHEAHVENYHSFWDDIILASAEGELGAAPVIAHSIQKSTIKVDGLEERRDMGRNRFQQASETDITVWFSESSTLAQKEAYLDGNLAPATKTNPFHITDEDFHDHILSIAEKRVRLASFRLADKLIP